MGNIYNKTEIGDFFRSKTENFEKNPPEEIWSKIQTQISQQTTIKSNINNKITLISTISAIIITGALITYIMLNPPAEKYYTPKTAEKQIKTTLTNNKPQQKIATPTENIQTKTNKETKKLKQEQTKQHINTTTISDNKSLITAKKEEKITSSAQVSAIAPASSTINDNEDKNIEEIVYKIGTNIKKQYFLNVSKIKNIQSITLQDINNNNDILKLIPENKKNDYIPIDISNVPVGKYLLKIQTDKNPIYKRLILTK
jgi:hypothetical protein